jgi:hypothetical protein
MKNRDLFLRDPATAKLMNNGQARINEGTTAQERATLREELSNFVCEGQYADGTLRILETFLSNIGATNQAAAWVSGFYGSGKTQLLKNLGHLWVNTAFPDHGETARSLVPRIPSEVEAALKELDTQGRRAGGLHAAFGTLPAGGAESVRLTVLGIVLRSCGLPENYAQAKFCLYLRNNGFFEQVKSAVEANGKQFFRELNNLFVSPVLREALLKADPDLGTADSLRDLLKREFSQPSDIPTAEFLRMVREVLGKDGKLPLTILVLDEVQLYISDSSDRATQVVEVAEAISKQLDSRVILVGAGQNALGALTAQFGKLRDRFTISVELSDADVETVTRRVLLAKKAEKVGALRQKLAMYAGEIERQLSGTPIATRASDRDILTDDYPILPVRRRFWEHVLRAVDAAGTSGMLRSQLRIIHDALRDLAEATVGTVVPADFMFGQLRAGLVQQGVLLRELDERIRKLDNDTPDGKLASRLCSLIFFTRKLPREAGADCGVRATPEMLADLLVSDLANDGGRLRNEVPALLQKLTDDGILLKDGDEYNLQTRESLEWEKEFRNRITHIANNDLPIHQKRDAYLRDAAQKEIAGVRLHHGVSKVVRKLVLHFGTEPPELDGQSIPVWIRDGWGCSEKNVVEAARTSGTDSAILFVFIPKASADELRQQIIREEAGRATIDFKGVPSTLEGQEARNAMSTRLSDAEHARKQLVAQLIAGAKVFKGGGTELFQLTLADKVREGATDALERLFPRFGDADHKNWASVINRARNGDESPLQAVEWTGTTDQHPVCREVLLKVATGIEGRELRRHFAGSPYGWPQDAVDGALIALHAGGHVTARYNGLLLTVGQLDQNKISKAEFRTETITLTATDKLKLRGLFQEAGLSARASDDLEAKSTEYLNVIESLARQAGGQAPLPVPPNVQAIADLRGITGNERLAALLVQAESLKTEVAKWKKAADLARDRLPAWQQLQRMLELGRHMSELAEVEAAARGISDGRLLLNAADYVPPLLKRAAQTLRTALAAAHQAYKEKHTVLLKDLEACARWKVLSDAQRAAILAEEGIAIVPGLEIGSDDKLMQALQQTPAAWWNDKTAALAARFQNAVEKAAKLLEPKARPVLLPHRTLATAEELDGWLAEVRSIIEQSLKDGPVLV